MLVVPTSTRWPPARHLPVGLSLLVVLLATGAGCSDQGDREPFAGALYVEIGECGGGPQVANGFAISASLVFSAAHPLEKAKSITVAEPDGEPVAADLVYRDEAKDIAIFRLRSSRSVPLSGSLVLEEQGSTVVEQQPLTVATVSKGDGLEPKSASVRRAVTVTLDGEGRREAIELDADIERGDSGAAVLDEQGSVVGMIFATTRSDTRGWAIAAVELVDALDELRATAPGGAEPLPLAC